MTALLKRAAEEQADAVAITEASRCTTFAEWLQRSQRFGAGLTALGVSGGDVVVLDYGGGTWTDFCVAYFGVAMTGAASVLATPYASFATTEIRSPSVVVSGRPTATGPAVDHETVMQEGEDSHAVAAVSPQPGDVAHFAFTSGTTGAPLVGVATHSALLKALHPRPAGARRHSILHPLAQTSYASVAGVMIGGIHARSKIVRMPSFDPKSFHDYIHRHSPTGVYVTPTMAGVLARMPTQRADCVRVVWSVGARLEPAGWEGLRRNFPLAVVLSTYGLTEAPGVMLISRFDPARPTCVGRATGAAAVRIEDDEGSRCVALDEGHVLVRAAPDCAWVRTGDTGFLSAAGELYITGRLKDVVNVGGQKVSAARVEGALLTHRSIGAAAVFAVPHDVSGEAVAAAVVAEQPVTVRDLRLLCAQSLSPNEVPTSLFFLDELPRTTNGKVDKRELSRMFGMMDTR